MTTDNDTLEIVAIDTDSFIIVEEESVSVVADAVQGPVGAQGKTANMDSSEYVSDPLAYYILAKS